MTATTRRASAGPVRLRQMRLRKLWSARELAARAGVSVQTVRYLERGKHIPTVPTIAKLCKALDVAPEAITWPGYPLEVA